MKNTRIFLLGLAVMLLAGCKTTSKPDAVAAPAASVASPVTVNRTLAPELLQPPTDMFVLGPGDKLDIEILGKDESRATVDVGLDGKIYFSLLPGIDVWGLTLAQAKSKLENELSKYFSEPQISLTLRSVGSRTVWLLGRLQKPGIYPLSSSMTLLEALSEAGGTAQSTLAASTTSLADLRHSFIMRNGKPLPVDFGRLLQEGDMSQNIYLESGDFVYIASALSQEVYVLGAVVSPRTVPYSDQMSVVSAVAGAGGPVPESYVSHVAIVRGSLNQPQIITVNYSDVIKGKAPNVALEPGDIVYVPLSPYRFLDEYADLIVTTFVRSWSANMGIRATSSVTPGIGVSVPVGTPTHY